MYDNPDFASHKNKGITDQETTQTVWEEESEIMHKSGRIFPAFLNYNKFVIDKR